MLSFVREHFAIIRAFGKLGATPAFSGKRPDPSRLPGFLHALEPQRKR